MKRGLQRMSSGIGNLIGAAGGIALLTTSASALAQPQFEEAGGFVVMEMESVPTGSKWTASTDLDSLPNATFLEGAVGTYYQYTGDNNICSGDPDGPLTYSFRINTAGMWTLNIRMAKIWHCVTGTRWEDEPQNPDNPPAHTHECREGGGFDRGCERLGAPDTSAECADSPERLCLRTDLSNDVFVAIRTAAGAFVPYEGRRNDDTREQVKFFYGGGADQFAWSDRIDQGGNPRFVTATWDLAAGDYDLIIAGRSRDCRLDRIVLSPMAYERNRDRNEALDPLTETLAPGMSGGSGGDMGTGTSTGTATGSSTGTTTGSSTGTTTGSSTGTTTGTSGSAGAASEGDGDGAGSDDSGCTIRGPGQGSGGALLAVVAILGLGLLRRRPGR